MTQDIEQAQAHTSILEPGTSLAAARFHLGLRAPHGVFWAVTTVPQLTLSEALYMQ